MSSTDATRQPAAEPANARGVGVESRRKVTTARTPRAAKRVETRKLDIVSLSARGGSQRTGDEAARGEDDQRQDEQAPEEIALHAALSTGAPAAGT